MRKRTWLVLFGVGLVGGIVAYSQAKETSRADLIQAASKYEVRILRDLWGVPHVFGKTDVDVAYGLGYAQAEDDMATIVEALLMSRGNLAAYKGKDAAPGDFMVHLLRVWPTVHERYEKDLSPQVRAICEAYADGVNHYAALHPGEVPRGILPFTGKDIVAGFVFKGPFFYGLDNAIMELFGERRRREVSVRKPDQTALAMLSPFELPRGSNTFAISPRRTADGSTFLNINSHQPWEGPVSWYEAHLHSEEGWDIVGGVFPGAPVILHGHNRHLGWAHTVNRPDLIDIYVLEMNPANPNQYKFDGEWKDLETGTARIKVKLWGPISWTVKREVLWSVYGPTVRREHGVYAIRYANMGDVRQVEQWYRMNKARNLDEWLDAMRMQAVASLNCGYADEKGNILYLYNAKSPVRHPGYDWKQYLPGDTSETLWTEFHPFDALPKVLNPACGYVANCNNTPFNATDPAEDPSPEAFPKTMGIETHMTNRGLRALELLSADPSITLEEFFAYKYDMAYSKESEVAKGWQRVFDATPPDDPVIHEALEVWKKWDLRTNPENTSAAICVLTLGPGSDNDAKAQDLDETFALMKWIAMELKKAHGRIDVPWSEVNRVHRGKVNMGIGGGPDVLHAVYGSRVRDGKLEGLEHGQIHGRAGDCYVLLAWWDKEGRVHSRSIHNYGAATTRADSPHYADQVSLFVRRETKPVWMDEPDIRANLEREYRPGDVN